MTRATIHPCARIALMAGIAALPLASFPAQNGHQGGPLRVQVRLVLMNTFVHAADGRAVSDLAQDRFRLFEDGQEQRIGVFASGDAPVHIALVLDTSGSTKEHLDQLKAAAKSFVKQFGPQDNLALFDVGPNAVRAAAFSTEHTHILSAIDHLHTTSAPAAKAPKPDPANALVLGAEGASTVLYEALAAIGREFPAGAQRRAIIAFTDSFDEGSRIGLAEMSRQLLQGSASLYAVMPLRAEIPKVAQRAVLGSRPVYLRVGLEHPGSGKRPVWMIQLDESLDDPQNIARLRATAARLLDFLPADARVWLMRFQERRMRLFGLPAGPFTPEGPPQPLSVEDARKALRRAEPEELPAPSRGKPFSPSADRVIILTDASRTGVRTFFGSVPPAWFAQNILAPDTIPSREMLDITLAAIVKSPEAYVKLQVSSVTEALQVIRGEFEELIRDSGGEVLEFRRPSDLHSAYDQIARQLKSSYVLGYYTNAGKGRHELRVDLTDPNLKARSRRVLVVEE